MRAALLFSLALWSAAVLAQPVCEVVALSGDAQRLDGKPLAAGDRLEVGTQLRTGPGGRVRLRFADGSVLVLADRSQLRLQAFTAAPGQPRVAEFVLDMGLVGQRVAPSANGSWQVRTPTAVTAVRGTEFSVEVNEERATAVHVKTGEVDVEPAGPQTRGIKPRQPVRLQRGLNGTQCDGSQCSAAVAWGAERVQRVEQRLGSLD